MTKYLTAEWIVGSLFTLFVVGFLAFGLSSAVKARRLMDPSDLTEDEKYWVRDCATYESVHECVAKAHLLRLTAPLNVTE
jgi:hypothetical protein